MMQLAFTPPLLSRLSELLAARTGLNFPPHRWADIERGIKAAAPVFGMPDAESCARWLLATPPTRNQIEILASHLAVGETYFFRDESCFNALEQHVLPALIQARMNGERRLRIWSAGCCTGEEAYSIAILLNRLIPDPAHWHVTILGTDINPAFLRKAARGIYGSWSFRSTPNWVRAGYFHPCADGRFELHAPIRKRVCFSYLNLVDDVYPSLSNNTNAMDVVICRNVLMYFTAAQARKVIDHLRDTLVDGGWLIVAPAETSVQSYPGLTAVEFPGAIFYRKGSVPGSSPLLTTHPMEAVQLAHACAAPAHAVEALIPLPQPVVSTPPRVTAMSRRETISPADCRLARDYANQGRLAEADACCEKAIAANRLDPLPQYLRALIQQEQGQFDLAMRSLARVLYLDGAFVLAYFALGQLHLACGQQREAARHFRNVLELLRALPPDEIVPESEGLSAGRLADITNSVLCSFSKLGTADA
ncbi:CheR family methyltransferase [Dyella flava]|nr:CheR family methyltransferase [Dyella flava]GLQ50784.1 protein-glutamate O-methyltransferase [Dyella flava]